MRLFVAVLLDPSVTAALTPLLARLRERREWRVVPDANVHVTCRFLGEVDEGRARAVAEVVQAVRPTTLLRLGLDGVGTFPAHGPPRVLLAGLCGEVPALAELVRRLEEPLAALGFAAEDRPFHPHVTLARAGRGRPARTPSGEFAVRAAPAPIAGMHLLRSTPGPQGSVYEVVE